MESIKKIPFLKILYNIEGAVKISSLIVAFAFPEYLYRLFLIISIMATIR